MTDYVLEVLSGILLAAFSGVVSIGIYYIKQNITAEKLQHTMDVVYTLVQAAEQVGAVNGWTGEEKRLYVIGSIAKFIKVPVEQVNAFIEAAVAELKAAGQEIHATQGESA